MSDFSLAQWDATIREVVASGGEFRMYPKGKSMLPLLREGVDSVSVSAPSFPILKGDMIFYLRDNGQYVIHRVQGRSADGTYVLCGDHQTQSEAGVREDMILAAVKRVFRGDREVPLRSVFYRVYRFLILRRFFRWSFAKAEGLRIRLKRR